jgi:folate-binding protein YgfZ
MGMRVGYISNMTETEFELNAIRESAAIAPITDRAFLRIAGPDATRWLNGMVTNSIQSLQPGEGNYNFLLNAQGRIQGDCTIYRETGEEPTFLLETDTSQLDTIHQLLDKFIIMDDVELTPGLQILGHAAAGLAVFGPKSSGLIHKLLSGINEEDEPSPFPIPKPGTITFAELPDKPSVFFPFLGRLARGLVIVLAPPPSSVAHYELWFQEENDRKRIAEPMESSGAVVLTAEALEAHRILSATPKFGQDIRNTETARDLPQETAQTHALHFAKGCYLGQEIVERIRSRGQVHRTFTQFHLSGSLPTLPAPLELNGKPAGELTSAIQIGDDIIALGYARREALDQPHPLTYPGGTAAPST